MDAQNHASSSTINTFTCFAESWAVAPVVLLVLVAHFPPQVANCTELASACAPRRNREKPEHAVAATGTPRFVRACRPRLISGE
jgi:hypothetical protein